jgi:hypothetical protein
MYILSLYSFSITFQSLLGFLYVDICSNVAYITLFVLVNILVYVRVALFGHFHPYVMQDMYCAVSRCFIATSYGL